MLDFKVAMEVLFEEIADIICLAWANAKQQYIKPEAYYCCRQ